MGELTGRPAARRRGRPVSEPPEDGPTAQDAEPDPESVARAIVLRRLTGAPQSRAQLADALARRDVPEGVASRVLDRFTAVGLIDDQEYARILVRSRHTERGLSRRALGVELRRKGIDDEIAAVALEDVDDADEERAARDLVQRRLRSTAGLETAVRIRRTYGALGRRGYASGLVARLVREELAREGADVDPEGADDGRG
ncbi:regulatory protein RecX [Cellulomonas sp. S1-8]|uniref:regulatory protein RecX n=1 Tax=Cellulomonas sp. S1-8 TaxID=2904790 RepID=UPI002244F1A3|nr:regulatory protein RecX [Cellulomonas sp. S1-8]UZN04902.1 recombination regulator RecX [Cellulomonas sp. S1-8]